MKIKFQYIIILACAMSLAACDKDNYAEPATSLKGRIVYKGEAINVENYQVPFELYQYGFGKVGPIGSSIAQDGSYSSVLFDGEYKFIIPNGQGPFIWKKLPSGAPDSVSISLHGSQTLDMEVMPYYMIRTAQITGGSGKVNGAFRAEKIIVDANAKNIESVSLFVNKTQFVSGDNNENIAQTTIAGAAIVDPNNITMSVTVPTISPVQNYVFARLSIKIAGVEDRIFSSVVKVTY